MPLSDPPVAFQLDAPRLPGLGKVWRPPGIGVLVAGRAQITSHPMLERTRYLCPALAIHGYDVKTGNLVELPPWSRNCPGEVPSARRQSRLFLTPTPPMDCPASRPLPGCRIRTWSTGGPRSTRPSPKPSVEPTPARALWEGGHSLKQGWRGGHKRTTKAAIFATPTQAVSGATDEQKWRREWPQKRRWCKEWQQKGARADGTRWMR
jgi:hypothetical protein